MSDLHLEHARQEPIILPNEDEYDIVTLLGDISNRYQGVAWAKKKFPRNKPVLFLLGNHERYGHDYNDIQEESKTWSEDNIVVLNPGCCVIDNVNFVGATLWSDAILSGYKYDPYYIERSISDFHVIRDNNQMFSVKRMQEIYEQEVQYIKDSIRSDMKNVILTHFMMSQQCIDLKYLGSNLNSYFCNDLDYILNENKDNILYWGYGHTHARNTIIHKESEIPMICHARGYPLELDTYVPLIVEI